jgi:hypothetical protein
VCVCSVCISIMDVGDLLTCVRENSDEVFFNRRKDSVMVKPVISI